MTFLISPLQNTDLDRVATLARIVWQDAYQDIITPAQIDFMLEQRYNAARLRDELTRADIWWDQASVAGELAAFASTQVGNAPGEVKLDKLYVDPAHQRLGIGAALIAHVAQRALTQGYATLMLAVNKRNARAIAAYTKSGFVVRDAVCVDIGNGFVMDDFIMARDLR